MEERDDKYVEEQENAAAEAAGKIGGDGGEPDDWDPSERPVREAGGGEQEGFEDSERELIENASFGEGGDFDEFETEREVESDRSTAAYGDADEVDATEVVRDPSEGDDDPGEGPGITADR